MATTKGLTFETRRSLYVLLDTLRGLGYTARFTSGYRSTEKQAALYLAWRAGRSRFPANPPGRSAHEHGLAVDIVSNAPDQVLRFAGEVAGLAWLGPSDRVHFGPAHV